MPTFQTQLTTTATPMNGGVAAVSGSPGTWRATFTNTWATDDQWSVVLTDLATARSVNIGQGYVTSIQPAYCFTLGDKVYVVADDTIYFSALLDATIWNSLAASGNGFIQLSAGLDLPEDAVTALPYQGRLAILARDSIQIYVVAPDPEDYDQKQVLTNIGTMAKLSAQGLGQLDAVFLSDSGIRSLRVRDSSLNAIRQDVGSPIDSLVVAKLLSATATQKASACAAVEPATGFYWIFVKDVFYVFSYYPESNILAWGTMGATYESGGVQTSFAIEKLVTYQGRMFARGSDGIYVYGGSANATYDNVTASFETPWLPARTPGTTKQATAIDAVLTGAWTIKAGMDFTSASPLKNVYVTTDTDIEDATSIGKGQIIAQMQGSHFKIRGQTTGSTAAKCSGLLWYYQSGNERG